MSSASTSTHNQPAYRSRGRCCGRGANWSGINIAAMIVGFVVFWPIGLFVLFWILTGRNIGELPQWIHQQWSRMTEMWNSSDGFSQDGSSDNVVFNEYQQTQYDRVREIKEEIKERRRRFTEFRANVKRRVDEEEFNRFMGDAPGSADA